TQRSARRTASPAEATAMRAAVSPCALASRWKESRVDRLRGADVRRRKPFARGPVDHALNARGVDDAGIADAIAAGVPGRVEIDAVGRDEAIEHARLRPRTKIFDAAQPRGEEGPADG